MEQPTEKIRQRRKNRLGRVETARERFAEIGTLLLKLFAKGFENLVAPTLQNPQWNFLDFIHHRAWGIEELAACCVLLNQCSYLLRPRHFITGPELRICRRW